MQDSICSVPSSCRRRNATRRRRRLVDAPRWRRSHGVPSRATTIAGSAPALARLGQLDEARRALRRSMRRAGPSPPAARAWCRRRRRGARRPDPTIRRRCPRRRRAGRAPPVRRPYAGVRGAVPASSTRTTTDRGATTRELARGGRRGVGPARGQRRVDAPAPCAALARVRPAHRDGIVAGVERDGDAVGAGGAGGARVEDRDERAAARIRPVAAAHRTAVRMPPLDVGDAARVRGRAGEPAVGAQRRVALAAASTSAATKSTSVVVGAVPVDPRQRVVLRVRVVVAALRASELVAHREHRRAARQQQRREQVADVAAARRADRGVGRRRLRRRDSTSSWRRCRRGCPRRSPRCASRRTRRGRRA